MLDRLRARREKANEPTQPQRDHAVMMIRNAYIKMEVARDVADAAGIEGAVERLSWALEFVADAAKEAEGRRDG